MKSVRRRMLTGLMAAAPLGSLALGSAVQATGPSGATRDDDGDNEVRAQINGSDICYPIVGTGKMSGVPIVVEDNNGELLSDISDLTFELRDGTGDTQDVTALIGTAAEQPVVADRYIQAGSDNLPSAMSWHADISDNTGGDGPSLSFLNVGHFFLMCTADPNDPAVKFGDDVTLHALRDGVEVASGTPAGRSAPHFRYSYWWTDTFHSPTLWPLMGVTSITDPQGQSDATAAEFAQTLYEVSGIRFDGEFALLALLWTQVQSMDGNNSSMCRYSFVNFASPWSLNTAGSAIRDALMTGTNLATQAAYLRENHPAVGCNDNLQLIPQNMVHTFAAQLLLIDGPAGRVPAAITDASDFYLPSVRLVPEDLPETGADTLAPLFAGLAAMLGGAAVLALPRRRRA